MNHKATRHEQAGKAKPRLRMIHRYEQVTRNGSRTFRFFTISRTQVYIWLKRLRQDVPAGLRDRPRGPCTSPLRAPPPIVALILRVRQEPQYGAVRLSLFF